MLGWVLPRTVEQDQPLGFLCPWGAPDFSTIPELNLCPTLDEVRVAITTLKNKKAPGEDSIPSKVFKYRRSQLVKKNSPNSSPYVGNKVRSLTPGRMPLSLLSTRWKVANQTVVTVAASPFLMLKVKYLLVLCSIACSTISLTKSSWNHKQDFGNNVAQLTPSL